MLSFDDAEKACAANNSELVSIRFLNEEKFLENYLFKQKTVVDNVWLGAKNTSNSIQHHDFYWKNGKNLSFSNWANGYPKNHSTDTCVQVEADEDVRGKWSNVPCTRKNAVVCEKAQTWTLSKMQSLLVQTMQNPVPLGFIFVQLPNEKSPLDFWPWMIWTDISSSFNGVFFRVANGGNAGSFGEIQEEDSPYLKEVDYGSCFADDCNAFATGATLSRAGGWSKNVFTNPRAKYDSNGQAGLLKFYIEGGEVRPKNMAVKVWKRTT